VQIVHSLRGGSRDIEHIGPAHDDAELEALKAAARQRMAAGQPELELGLDLAGLQAGAGAGGVPPAITSAPPTRYPTTSAKPSRASTAAPGGVH
jgi:hypothetical protein